MSIFQVKENSEDVYAGLFESNGEYDESIYLEGDPAEKVVILEVDGVIQDSSTSYLNGEGYNHDLFMNTLNTVLEDDSVKGLVLQVNSPGGGVTESAEVAAKLEEIEERIPVYVSMGTMAASGGYYISAGADKIYAPETCMTGSIGVIMSGLNFSGLLEKYGIQDTTVKSGPYKDVGSPTRPTTPEDQAILQSMVDNAYEGFVDIVAEGRGMTADEVKLIADGRVMDGKQAKEAGLIDEFGYLEDTVDALLVDEGLEGAEVVKWTPVAEANFTSMLSYGMKGLVNQEAQSVALLNELQQANSPRLMYMYTAE